MAPPAQSTRPPGGGFRTLWLATASSNLGDGVALVAAPLLAVTLTADPVAIAGLTFAQRIPWLLFPLLGGALADRLDRRRLMVAVACARAALVATLAAMLLSGHASLPLLYAVFFLLSSGETLFDTAAATILPALVPRAGLPRANARLSAARSSPPPSRCRSWSGRVDWRRRRSSSPPCAAPSARPPRKRPKTGGSAPR